jgi:hypothetical protein
LNFLHSFVVRLKFTIMEGLYYEKETAADEKKYLLLGLSLSFPAFIRVGPDTVAKLLETSTLSEQDKQVAGQLWDKHFVPLCKYLACNMVCFQWFTEHLTFTCIS